MSKTSGVSTGDRARAFVEMTKPRIIELLLITTLPAMVVAADGWPGLGLVVWALVGGALSAGGANVINQVYDDDIDRIMHRTEARPLPTSRVGRGAATVFGIALGAAGFAVLALGTTLLAGLLSVVAYLFYVLVYTMLLKRWSTQNIVLGGAAGAVPALIGWAAVANDLSGVAWIMFGIVFFWTPPHFWALALKYEDDYRAAGVPMMPVIAGERATFDLIMWYSVITVGMSLLLVAAGDFGWVYATIAIVLGVLLVGYATTLRKDRTRSMKYFGYTNLYLAAVFLGMMVDTVIVDGGIGAIRPWLVAGSVFVLVGMAMVATVESGKGMRAPGVSALRHGVEVGITATVSLLLVAVAWFAGAS